MRVRMQSFIFSIRKKIMRLKGLNYHEIFYTYVTVFAKTCLVRTIKFFFRPACSYVQYLALYCAYDHYSRLVCFSQGSF